MPGFAGTTQVPGDGLHDRLHVGDAAHRVAVPVRPVEAERGAPVVHDEGHIVGHAQGAEQRVKVVPVLGEGVGAGPASGELPRVAHADQIGGDAAAGRLQVRQDVPP